MVREWSHVVSKVNWSRFGLGCSRRDTFLGRIVADFCHFWAFLAVFGHFWPIFSLFSVKPLLENPRFPRSNVGLRSGRCGSGRMLLLKSFGVGLDRFGVDQTRFWGESWRILFSIFGHFWPFLPIFGHFRPKCIRPKPAKGAQAVVVMVFFLGLGCSSGPSLNFCKLFF